MTSDIVFSLKDVVQLVVFSVSVAAVIFTLKGNQKSLSKDILALRQELGKDITLLKKVIFREDGEMNVVTKAIFRESQDAIYQKIREESDITRKAFKQIDDLKTQFGDLNRSIVELIKLSKEQLNKK